MYSPNGRSLWHLEKEKKIEIAPVFLKFSLKDVLSCANLSGTALVTNLTILGEYISPINDLNKSGLQLMY